MTVASAVPSTPMPQSLMEMMSSPMFSTEDSARNSTGVLLSPRERRMAARMLYSSAAGMPRKMMKIYW